MGNQDIITLVVASDNQYAILLGALLKSIEENHKTGEKIDVYVLDDKISASNKSRISSTVNPERITLNWKTISSVIPPHLTIPVDNTAFPFTAYYRIFASHAIPADRERVIYLDVDMIVLADISKLWKTDIGDCLFAAVQDWQLTVSCSWGGIPNYKELGIPADTKYFNSGLLIMNAKKWRDEDITTKVIKFMHENVKFINYADQYGLNGALYDRWFQLDSNWNCFAQFENEAPYIIHFLDVKPIFKSYRSRPEFKEEFYKYLRLTPWKDHKPVTNYNRLFKKIYTKVKKKSLQLFSFK
ncbi:glycosyltransferase family 8 protein [Paradesertivirga mongoliensis]|uniref:Glycosyltransferase family 8 protein n=1 Tax=Paradesertivirga mongoliensis TaxID=2100740 RepID=A0ABW4ZN64_9SPHI|nr:glycosyltransferase family 8 protein [Pedobacter mongoliensis]